VKLFNLIKAVLLLSCCIAGGNCLAQDSLFAIRKDGNLVISYEFKQGESVRMLALRFTVSEGAILNANDPADIKKLAPGATLYIPVSPENNYYSLKQPLTNMGELYYHVAQKDDIGLVSTYMGDPRVTKSQIRNWNNLKGNTLFPGQVLFVGWVKMIPRDTTNPAYSLAYPSRKKRVSVDTLKPVVPGGLDTVYARQTNNGMNVLTEKGTAVFFEKTSRSNVCIAFHNTARRGTIIKVYNPGNGKVVYARVLGPIPNTKQYANSIIGISEQAKEALGVTDSKTWCELSYSPE
jgi:LysM repeat protein